MSFVSQFSPSINGGDIRANPTANASCTAHMESSITARRSISAVKCEIKKLKKSDVFLLANDSIMSLTKDLATLISNEEDYCHLNFFDQSSLIPMLVSK